MVPKKEQVVYCERCNRDLLRFTRDIYAGEPVLREQFEPIGKQILPLNGERHTCTHCGSYFDIKNFRPAGLGSPL